MATRTGKDGKVFVGASEVTEITKWSLKLSSNNPDYSSSSTAGYRARRAGNKDSSGSFEFKVDVDGAPQFTLFGPGDEVTLKLRLMTGKEYTVPAIIDDIDIDCDVDGAGIVTGVAAFSGTGAVTEPNGF
jgi:hypothetical protein